MLTGVVGIVFFVFFVFILYGNGEAVRLRCDNQGYREGTGRSIDCDTVGGSTSNVSWSIVSNTGETTDLGWCDGIGSCRSLQSGIRLYRSSITYSYIQIYPIKQEMAGTVICTETQEGRIHTDNCTLRVVSIALWSCGENGYEIREGYNTSISCYVSTSYSARAITWTLQHPTGLTTYLGTCYSTNNCTSPLDPYIRVERTSTTRSYLRITGMKRETGGTLVCSDGHEVSSCTLDVQTRDTVFGDCSLEVYRHNWTAVGSCEVTKTYSALGKIGYRVYQTWTNPSFEILPRYLFAGRRHVTPTVFTDSTDGKVYYRVNITYSWPLPTQDGSYLYTVYTYPASASKQIPDRIFIENPTAPTHNCTDLNYLPESGRVPCVCSTSSLGSPAGRLIWFSGDTVLAAGQYGVTSLQFPSDKITRADDRTPGMACSLDWTTGVNVTITNHVAYGPDEVIIGEMASDDVNILLNCTVLGLNPLLPDKIQWGGLCQGQSGFTCQITNSAIVDDRKEVTCTVTNVHNNNHSVTANFTITDYGGSKSSPRFQPEGIAAGAGGVLAVVVVVAVVVLVVMWKRGHHLLSCGQSPSAVYEDTSPTHQDTGFHMYTDLRNSKARPASTNKESAGQQSNRGADNTSAELQHSNDESMYQNM